MKRPQLLVGALVAGIGAGLLLRFFGTAAAIAAAGLLNPFGQLWVQGLQMTLVPLIFTMVASGIASAAVAGVGGRMLGGAMLLFLVLLFAGVMLGAAATAALVTVWPLPPGSLSGLPHAVSGAPPLPDFGSQMLALVPANPVAAAAGGQMMPLVLFAILFGLAATRVPVTPGLGAVDLFRQVAHIMLVIVEWVLWFAPAGIFILALTAALHSAAGMASVLAHYVALEIAVPVLAIGGCYGLVALGSRIGVGRFAKGVLAPQMMAVGTCSSMATLPAMIEAATERLDVPEAVAGTVLPLAVTSFRFASTASAMVGVVLASYAAGLHPSATQIVLAAALTVLANMGSAGLPAAAVVFAATAPGFQLLGAPLGLIPLYIAVIAIPDIFLTTANVTADLTVTTLVAQRLLPRQAGASPVFGPAE